MRNQQELNVDAHTRAVNAADRTRTQRRLQEAVQPSKSIEPWWSELWHRWFQWETLTVAGKVIEKGWVVPQPLGIALLVVVLGFGGTAIWRVSDAIAKLGTDNSDMRILLNRLDERSQQDDKHRREEKQQLQQQIESIKSHQAAIESVMNKQFAELKAQR
jgi:hypothetical protein